MDIKLDRTVCLSIYYRKTAPDSLQRRLYLYQKYDMFYWTWNILITIMDI